MDARAHERARTALHGVVTPKAAPRLRSCIALMGAAALALLAGLAGGLTRAGVPLPSPGAGALLGEAAALHAALLVGGFFGSVIGIERAVAHGTRAAWTAPVASALGALAMLAGLYRSGAALLVVAAAALLAVGVALWRRQRAAHTALLVVASAAWLAGNLALVAAGVGSPAATALGFDFLVVTIAAERLEMTRLMRRRPAAQPLLVAIVAALLGGALLGAWHAAAGGALHGAALVALALWLGRFDIATRTVRAHGLSRYMAVCLLGGYVWLGVAGVAWIATAAGIAAARDVALHALGLGFVVAMVMAHAPVILPALARIRLAFGASFYAPLALLHASLALRAVGAVAEAPAWRAAGAVGNTLAILVFAATMAAAARRWRRRPA